MTDLSDMVDAVQLWADDTDATWATTANVTIAIQQIHRQAYNLLAASNAFGVYVQSSEEVTLVAGTQVYTLTAKPKQINRIWYLDTSGSTDRTELRMAGVEEFGIDANYLAVGATAPGQKLRWRWMNYKLYVWPLPSGSGYLEVWYTPKYTALTGDFPDYYPESIRDWIIYDVTAMFLGRVETDNSYWVGKAQQARRDFVNDLANPVRAAPNKIRRVYPKVM